MVRFSCSLLTVMLLNFNLSAQTKAPAFKIGVAGLTHAHVHWILDRADDGDIELVGVAEPDKALAERFLKQHNLPLKLWYPSLQAMLDKTKPEAVTAFGSIFEHLGVVRLCAPKKIHVMVEKPLAVNMEHALQMKDLAKRHGIQLLTNYETTWYASNLDINDQFRQSDAMGKVRKVVIHDGHQGPKEIGCNVEFLNWLTDPVQNGGGALTDFGCYGANLLTWLMKGQRPISVSAVTQQFKPDIYPNVDDEATIIVAYQGAQGIIQASWNWPYSRKDIEVYGEKGSIIGDREGARRKMSTEKNESTLPSRKLESPYHDPFVYLAAVVRGQIKVDPSDLSALENNLLVVEILDAAKLSAKEGRRVTFK
jgi:predicted dehydrogenase